MTAALLPLPRTPVPVRPFPDQFVLRLARVQSRDADGPVSSFVHADYADKGRAILADPRVYVSSSVDIQRPWTVSYRAAQRKSNASLPGDSPHFLGLSFDVDLRLTRAAMNVARDMQVRTRLAEMGAFPHPDTEREVWHNDLLQCHPAGYLATYRRLFGTPLIPWGCFGDAPGMEWLWQRALASIDDPSTGKPYYQWGIDGGWGPRSRAAYRAFAEDWPAAWIRPKGRNDWAQAVTGTAPPTVRGRWILATFCARFEVVTP